MVEIVKAAMLLLCWLPAQATNDDVSSGISLTFSLLPSVPGLIGRQTISNAASVRKGFQVSGFTIKFTSLFFYFSKMEAKKNCRESF